MDDVDATTSIIASVDESGLPAPLSPPGVANVQSPQISTAATLPAITTTPSSSPSSSSTAPGSASFISSLRRVFASGNNAQHGRKFLARVFACINPRAASVEQAHTFADFQSQITLLPPTYVPSSPLLGDAPTGFSDKPCLVLDLDETLVHSSFSPIDGADFEIPLNMQGETHTVFVKKRPGVDNFLSIVCESFEVVVFTASLALYANPVMDLLDPFCRVHGRLYREHCVYVGGCYVKDIAKLGRDLKRIIIIDNSPLSYAFQPENAIPIDSFFTDDDDRELEKILALLEKAKDLQDVRNLVR